MLYNRTKVVEKGGFVPLKVWDKLPKQFSKNDLSDTNGRMVTYSLGEDEGTAFTAAFDLNYDTDEGSFGGWSTSGPSISMVWDYDETTGVLTQTYESATNWSVYAEQIKPLSEYVE